MIIRSRKEIINKLCPHPSTNDQKDDKTKKKEEKEKVDMVGLIELFKFVDGLDQLLILTGVLCASVAGCMFPLMFYIFGDLTNAFALQAVIPPDQFMDLVIAVVWKMCAIGKNETLRLSCMTMQYVQINIAINI